MLCLMSCYISKLSPRICEKGSVGSGLSAGDEFLLVLMKLSHFLTNQDLAYRFGTHVTKVSKVFHHWIDLMVIELKPLITWPDKGMILSTSPESFKPHYRNATCIIDCSEVFIERPTFLIARAQTYSNYKSGTISCCCQSNRSNCLCVEMLGQTCFRETFNQELRIPKLLTA